MVLSMRAALWPLLVAGLVVLVVGDGCIQRTPVARLPDATAVAVAFVQDADGEGAARDVPEALKDAVVRELRLRNLEAEVVPFSGLQDAFSRLRATPRRYAYLAEHTQAPLLLLVETRATFFSQMSGRYRWVVQARLTGNLRQGPADATARSVEEPVLLVFDHQREPEALAAAAPRVAESAGTLFDDLLATPPSPPQDATGLKLPGQGAIYFVMVDRFANGDPTNDGDADPKDPAAFQGGDLKGLIDRLDELKSLGVETVWLSPIFQMRTEKFHGHGAFHGYWVEDLMQVEPRFGDTALLRRLSDQLHARGMKLVLDMVLNHVGPDTRLVTEKPQWFNKRGPLTDWENPVHLEHHDVHGLPDLAVEKEEVYAFLLRASQHWIREVRPDGFRLDAVKHMPASFWRRYNADIKAFAGPDFLLLGEMLDGDPRVIARTWEAGRFDALFDFPLHFAVNDVVCRGEAATKLGAVLSADRTYPDAFGLVTLPDNHDLPRLWNVCGQDPERVKRALLLTLTARGTPSLTWGTEAALAGAQEPHNRAMMRFDRQPLRPFISRVLQARAQSAALRTGIPLLVDVGPDRFVQARVEAGEAAVVAVNTGARPLTVTLPEALSGVAFRDILGEKPAGLVVPPRSVRVFVGEAASPTALAELKASALATWKGTAPRRQVAFRVSGAPLGDTDVLHLVGSAPELGGWDAGRAPVVKGGQLLAAFPPGAVTEFKLVVRRDGDLRWEAGENRALVVPGGDAPLEIPVVWRGEP
jgi:glycosidase